MIKSFKNALTEAVFNDETRKGFPADLIKVARRKLGYLNAAATLDDLRVPPANRLSGFALSGPRRVQRTLNSLIITSQTEAADRRPDQGGP